MNIDPQRSDTGRAGDLGTSIDAFGDEGAARQLVDDATRIFQSRVADAPPDFVMQVFGRATAEDLVRYDASEIADVAAGTWRFLGERELQTPKIQIGNTQSTTSPRLNDVSIVEILNDDMPFLVDSVMTELSEQGFDPHLVLHPRFIVERDTPGSCMASPARVSSGGAKRNATGRIAASSRSALRTQLHGRNERMRSRLRARLIRQSS